MANTKIVSLKDKKKDNEPAIIGYFEGKSGDGTVINENGLEIGVDVWKTVFDSDEFKSHLKNGFYIGFLGHPDDPGCQDFKDACIILQEAHIDNNGEVFAKCALVNTPVGRIVKTFIDAGVHFGLSVRGAGNITGSSVDPDDFIFRGFDVVAFPAYTDAIPEFIEIAASTNPKDRAKYRKICASIDAELPNISNVCSLKEIQGQFAENSEPYRQIEDRMCKLGDVSGKEPPCEAPICEKPQCPEESCKIDFMKCKIEGLMSLYLKSLETIKDLTSQLEEIQCMMLEKEEMIKEKERRLDASTHIYESQMSVMTSKYEKLQKENDKLDNIYKRAISANSKLKRENKVLASEKSDLLNDITELKNKSRETIRGSRKIEQENQEILAENQKIKEDLETAQNKNLNYKCRINSSNDAIAERDSIISSLETQLNETVSRADVSMKKLSNCGDEIDELKSDVNAALDLVAEYQNAYAELYASIVGVNANGLVIANTTSVSELKDCIMSSTSTANISVNPDYLDFTEDEDEYEEDEYSEYYDEE